MRYGMRDGMRYGMRYVRGIYFIRVSSNTIKMTSWQQGIKQVVDDAIDENNVLRIVLSPDVDGILATVIVGEYVRRAHGATIEVIGTYDSCQVRLVPPSTMQDAKRALWVDIDTDVPGVQCIGQHFLGTIKAREGYFNPNLFFHVLTNMRHKCPISTTHLVLWGLFECETDASPIFAHKFSLARSAVCHADSLYIIVDDYRENVVRWSTWLFPDGKLPATLSMLLDGTYRMKSIKVHHHMLTCINNDVVHYSPLAPDWSSFKGRQSVGDEHHMETVNKLLQLFSRWLKVSPPVMLPGESIGWKGSRVMLDTMKYDWCDPRFESVLQEEGVVSHALVNSRICSATVGVYF